MASAAPAPAADADAPAPVGGEGGGAAANNKAKPKPNNKKKEKKIYELKLHPSNAYASDVALGTSVRKLKDDTPIYLNNLLHECGFVYVWKLPIVIKQGNVVRDDLVVLNVGKSQDKWLDEDTPTSVLNRLHEEKASWAKIGVELDVPSFGAQDPLLPVPALQTLATVKKWFGEGKGTDLATLLCRYRKTARHVDDVHTRTQATENFVRGLVGVTLPTFVVEAWAKQAGLPTNKHGQFLIGKLGGDEFVLSTDTVFKAMRTSFKAYLAKLEPNEDEQDRYRLEDWASIGALLEGRPLDCGVELTFWTEETAPGAEDGKELGELGGKKFVAYAKKP